MKKIFEEKYFFWNSNDFVQIEVEKATSEETVKSINLKNGDYLITVKYISADKKELLTHSLPFSAKTDIRECLKSVHNSLCRYCDIDLWSKEGNDIFMTFSYGINEVLSNIAKNEAKEKEVVKLPIIYDLNADEETNTVNNIKYYLEEIKKDVKYSVLMVHDESYSHATEDFISFLEPLSSNPMSCFKSCNLAIIEKEYMNILLAAYHAGLRAGISVFPLEESYFYRFLYLCRRGVENKIELKHENTREF